MNTKTTSIEEIRSTLARLRQDPTTKRRFPSELWDTIIQLTKTYSIKEVCRQLEIDPVYLKRKIPPPKKQDLEFREISPLLPPDVITIELTTIAGLKAKIRGPVSCLNHLSKLFGR